MLHEAFAPLPGRGAAPFDKTDKTTATAARKWEAITPVPDDAPRPPTRHFKLGVPTAVWRYADAAGRTLGFVHRYDAPDGKVFRPLILARPVGGGALAWRWESWPTPRPLYGLDRLAAASDAPVVVCEGEKATDAVTGLLPGFVAVTSPNGSKSAGKADWSPLAGRRVIVWPDADTAGLAYAAEVAWLVAAAGATAVAIVSPPAGVAVGWDAADAVADGWTEDRAAELIDAAPPAATDASTTTGEKGSKRRAPAQRDMLIGLVDAVEFWHDGDRTAYASYEVAGHVEHWPVKSREFRMFMSGLYFEKTGGAIGGQALEDGLRILEARAVHDGPQRDCCIRVGRHGDALYLDLCDASWRAAEIDAGGWRVVARAPVKFRRSPAMRPLPEPEPGYQIEELNGYLNVRDDSDRQLVVAWIVAALRDRGPYPILVVNGEQGAGKSVFSRMVRLLVDPNAAPIRAVPRDDRDLVVSAGNAHVLAFDNLSSVPNWLSDALCRMATGGGFATRALHTDREEIIFEAQRPILLNGIPQLTDRADLADRAVNIHLVALPEAHRRPEEEVFADFEAARPRILGALLDAVSAALRHLPGVKLKGAPRMADFTKWVTAAEAGLGWEPGSFVMAYERNRTNVSDSAFEADFIAVAVRDLVLADHPQGWSATPTEWHTALNARASESVRKLRTWPAHAQAFGNRIDRATPLLKRKGFFVERQHSERRLITIVPPGAHVDDTVPV